MIHTCTRWVPANEFEQFCAHTVTSLLFIMSNVYIDLSENRQNRSLLGKNWFHVHTELVSIYACWDYVTASIFKATVWGRSVTWPVDNIPKTKVRQKWGRSHLTECCAQRLNHCVRWYRESFQISTSKTKSQLYGNGHGMLLL